MKQLKWAVLLLVFSFAQISNAQVQNNGGGDYRLFGTVIGTAIVPKSFTIGHTYNVVGGSALNVRGDQLGVGMLTGEVFRTVAPAANNTFWRLYSGGTAAGNERGQLFANTGQNHFNINAPNGHFRLYTNTIERARLNSTLTGTIGQFANVNRDGFMLVSGEPDAFTSASSRAPFTRLHLVDDVGNVDPNVYAQDFGFRPWQRNGVTFTGNSDQGYIGQKYAGDDNTDLVIQWSDNPDTQPWGCDRMKFVFSSTFLAGTLRGMNSLDGMEAMRFWPVDPLNVNVGIGDFAPPAMGDPTERLDMLNGRLRVRELPDDPAANGVYKVMVVDASPAPSGERGVVKWVEPSVFGGTGSDCDWAITSPTVSDPLVNHNVYTATGNNDLCPDRNDLVGIGVQPSAAKLQVQVNMVTDAVPGTAVDVNLETAAGAIAQGINVRVQPVAQAAADVVGVVATVYNGQGKNEGTFGNAYRTDNIQYTQPNIGAHGRSDVQAGQMFRAAGLVGDASAPFTNEVKYNNGVYADASGGDFAYGVQSVATGGTTSSHGAHVEAWGNSPEVVGLWANSNSLNGSPSTGVLASANGAVGNTWAIMALGSGLAFGGTWENSDQNLKTEMGAVDAAQAVDQLDAIALHRYVYNADQYPQLHLPEGEYLGVFAQELAELYPDLVRDVTVPAIRNADGTVVHEAVQTKAVNRGALIPHLVAGHQQQSARMTQMEAQMAQMQELLAACCANPTSDQRIRLENGDLILGKDRDLIIQPNPFSEPPTVFYTLERAGRMQLVANSADGKQLRVLHEANMEAGQYQHEWHTSDLSPGVYYVTLLLDGEPIVKKAVKVQR